MEKELVIYAPEFPASNDSMAVSFVKMVKLNLVEAQKSFFEIGFRLYEAQKNEYYKELGFESLVDCAEHHFDFKKTLVYDLINVYIAFNENNTKFINPKYKDFSQSQLIEMSKIKTLQVIFSSMCKPTDSVKKIREARKIFTKHCLELYDCKSLDSLISAYEQKQKKDKADIVIEEAIINGEPVLEEENEIDEEPIQVTYESKGIELKADAPKEENTEITEEILPEAKKRDEISKGLYNELLKLFSSTPGISFIMRDSLAKKIRKLLYEYLKSQKKELVNLLNADFSKYDYKITLHDRTQALNVFIGVLLNNVFECLEPPKESKK
ncbi:MAG: hypothetical protein J6A53_02650 [Clostridia bacterium]|nr:hypothetical protein [Clostridia bacterium]